MGKKRNIQQAKLANTSGLRPQEESLMSCPVDRAFFEQLESLLPLLLFDTSQRNRKELQKALQLSESLLNLKEKTLNLQLQQKVIDAPNNSVHREGGHLKSADREPDRPKTKPLAQIFASLSLTSLEDYLEQCRESIYENFEGTVPKDVQEWVLHWPKKIDETVGEEYLKCLGDAAQFVEDKWQNWQQAQAKIKGREFGLAAKLRSLKFSSQVKTEIKETHLLQRKIERTRKSAENSKAHLLQLSGSLAAFLRLQGGHLEGLDKSARRLIAFEVEKELHQQLRMQANTKDASMRANLEVQKIEAQKLKEKRNVVLQIEDKKSQLLLQGFAQKLFADQPDFATPVLNTLLSAFEPMGALKRDLEQRLAQLRSEMKSIRHEFLRYREIASEYVNQFPGKHDTEGSAPNESGDAFDSFARKAFRTSKLDSTKRN
jgi:hypothetical protein